MSSGCQWIGPEQDPQKGPVHYCGAQVFLRSYCHDHIWRVYQKGSSMGTKRQIKELEKQFLETVESDIDVND